MYEKGKMCSLVTMHLFDGGGGGGDLARYWKGGRGEYLVLVGGGRIPGFLPLY